MATVTATEKLTAKATEKLTAGRRRGNESERPKLRLRRSKMEGRQRQRRWRQWSCREGMSERDGQRRSRIREWVTGAETEMEWSERETEFFWVSGLWVWEDCECGNERVFWVLWRVFFLEDCECGREWESFLRVEFFWETRLSDAWQKRKHKSSPMDLISIYKKWVH